MESNLENYLDSLKELRRLRMVNNNAESKEEDNLLDAMDDLWWELTMEEREHLQAPRGIDFMQVVPNSQFYESLDQILFNLERLKHEQTQTPGQLHQTGGLVWVSNPDPVTLDEIIIGVRNTINRGYEMTLTKNK